MKSKKSLPIVLLVLMLSIILLVSALPTLATQDEGPSKITLATSEQGKGHGQYKQDPKVYYKVPFRNKVYKIGVMSISHETCTYCPDITGIEDWGAPTDQLLGRTSGTIGAFEQRMQNYGGVEFVGITSPSSGPVGGSARSWNTKETWDYFTGLMYEDLIAKGPFDAIHVNVHGAMAVAGVARPEAELAKIIRSAVGPDCIISYCSFDPHANEDAMLVKPLGEVDIMMTDKRFPHYESTWLIPSDGADVVMATLQGKYKPTIAVRKPGVISPSFFQETARSPLLEIMERARVWENQYPGTYVSVNFGFAYADVPDNGASIFVMTNNDPELANEIADDMNEFFWSRREKLVFKDIYYYPNNLDSMGRPVDPTGRPCAVERVLQAIADGALPVVVADGADRTGGATWIVQGLLDAGVSNMAVSTLEDKALIEELTARGLKVGDHTGPIEVAGKSDIFAGEPIQLADATIEFMSNRYVVLNVGNGNRIWVSDRLVQVTAPEWHASFGYDPLEDFDIFVHKTRVHFYRGYWETQLCGEPGDGYPGTIVRVQVPGWGPADVLEIDYKNGGKYLYPHAIDREIGGVWDRPFIDLEDMVFETGDGTVVPVP